MPYKIVSPTILLHDNLCRVYEFFYLLVSFNISVKIKKSDAAYRELNNTYGMYIIVSTITK